MIVALSSVISIGTMLVMWLLSGKNRLGWKVSLANQGLWLLLIILTQAWGLLILQVYMVFICIRALKKWKK